MNPAEFYLLDFRGRYFSKWQVPAEFSLPELQDRLDKLLVRPVMRLRISAVFVECGAEDDIFRNQDVPAAILDFRDLQSPPALRFPLPAETLFLAAAIWKAYLDETAPAFRIPYRPFEKSLRVFTASSSHSLLQILRDQAVEMRLSKSDGTAYSDERDLATADPVSQRAQGNPQVDGSFWCGQ